MGNLHGFTGTPRGRLMLKAGVATVLLSLLFMVVYGGTNWLTSLRTDVGTWYYSWEKYIPFVPLMVISLTMAGRPLSSIVVLST